MYAGSRREKTGYVFGLPAQSFSCVERREMTKPGFHSLPVAGRVMTAPNGRVFSGMALLPRILSQGSSLGSRRAAAQMNLVASQTDPPPTAMRRSGFLALTTETISKRRSYSGFGQMPPSHVTSHFRSSRTAWTSAREPFLSMEPEPNVQMILEFG